MWRSAPAAVALLLLLVSPLLSPPEAAFGAQGVVAHVHRYPIEPARHVVRAVQRAAVEAHEHLLGKVLGFVARAHQPVEQPIHTVIVA